MFEHLPYITEDILYHSHNEDLEALLADVKTPLAPVRRENPNLYRAIQLAVQSVVQDIHDDELRERITGNIYAEMFIVMRLIDLAIDAERAITRGDPTTPMIDNFS